MALVEFNTNENVNRGKIHVKVNQLKHTYLNDEESQYIYFFDHKGGRIRERPPALIYCSITEEYASFIDISSSMTVVKKKN